MKTKIIPLFLMLLAGAITSIIMYIFQYDFKKMLTILLIVLFVFYIFGCILKKIIDSFEKQIAEAKAKEGEVIEKDIIEETKEEEGITSEEEK